MIVKQSGFLIQILLQLYKVTNWLVDGLVLSEAMGSKLFAEQDKSWFSQTKAIKKGTDYGQATYFSSDFSPIIKRYFRGKLLRKPQFCIRFISFCSNLRFKIKFFHFFNSECLAFLAQKHFICRTNGSLTAAFLQRINHKKDHISGPSFRNIYFHLLI